MEKVDDLLTVFVEKVSSVLIVFLWNKLTFHFFFALRGGKLLLKMRLQK